MSTPTPDDPAGEPTDTLTAPPGWVPPWDEPWVKVHKLTRPMFITLYDAHVRGTGRVRSVYPGGQWRLIRHGLYARWLIDERWQLTMSGLVLSIWAARAITRAYPARPADDPEVRTR